MSFPFILKYLLCASICAFDISNAEQIQTEISDVYPASNHFICSCVSVEIEYYTENGVNIATKLTSNGQEIAPLYFKE